MFENEAKERAKRKIYNFIVSTWGVSQIRTEQTCETVEGGPHFYQYSLEKMWQEGAEYGYNKANEWHYIGEEGLPAEVDKYYFIAYQTVLGLSGGYCKLIEKTRPIVNVFESTITGYETTKMWECEDSETMAYLNERGHVYAWKSLPDLPEYREFK